MGMPIPRQSQGAFIDEVIELSSFTEEEKKLVYYDYRQQQQVLLTKLSNSNFI
jgi:hypothetical protein